MGFVVIPGSRNVAHIKDNIDIFDFELTKEEMKRIAELDKNLRYHYHTDEQMDHFAKWQPKYEDK